MSRQLYLGSNKLINILFFNHIQIVNILSNYTININYQEIYFFNKLQIFNFSKLERKIFIKQKRYLTLLQVLIKKAIISVIRGYCLILNVIGLGFTMTIWKENQLRFNIGYNHLIYYFIPSGVLIRSKSRRNLFLFSNSFFLLKKVAVEIKNFRNLSIYKLKGIKQRNELYIKKNWKKASY